MPHMFVACLPFATEGATAIVTPIGPEVWVDEARGAPQLQSSALEFRWNLIVGQEGPQVVLSPSISKAVRAPGLPPISRRSSVPYVLRLATAPSTLMWYPLML